MGFYPLKLSLADKTTGLPITSYTQLNLRRYNYSVPAYSQLSQSGGTYEFGNVGTPIIPGDYKLYDNATELTAFGIIRIGEPDAVLLTENNTVSGDNTFSGENTFTGNTIVNVLSIEGNATVVTGNTFSVVDAPTTANHVVRLTDLSGYAVLTGGNEFNDTQVFQDTVEIAAACDFSSTTPTCASADGTEGANYLINQGALQDAIDAITVVPFQESLNDLRIIPAGVQETNKVYTTITGGQGVAASFATTNWRFVLKIEGTGTAANYLTLVDEFVNYVSYKGVYSGIILHFEDINYNSVTVLGNTTIENVILYRHDSNAGTPTFTNTVFKDVYFDCETSSLSFVNCQFKGNCAVKNSGGTISFDGNCIGGYVATNGAITARMFGIDGLTSTDF